MHRRLPHFESERKLRDVGYRFIAGVDEAGRGCLAGPVVAGAVILPLEYELAGVRDSKKLAAPVREKLYDLIASDRAIAYSVGICSPGEIDSMNILRAAQEAMRRAVAGLVFKADHALIDGLPVDPFPIPQTAVIRGDETCMSISAASIVAKVTRDRMMLDAARDYPDYGFETHKGYGTARHLDALRRLGPCALHRRTFGPVRQVCDRWAVHSPRGDGDAHQRAADPSTRSVNPPDRAGGSPAPCDARPSGW